MRYTFFEFENFKGIRHGRLDLEGSNSARVFTLVGLNESGKTTILEAIDHFESSDDEASPKELGGWTRPDPHRIIPISSRTNFNGDITIKCGVELDEDDVEEVKKHLKSVDGYQLSELGTSIEIVDRYSYTNSQYAGRPKTAWTGLKGAGKTKQGKIVKELSHSADIDRWSATARFLRSRLPPIWYFPNFLFEFPEKIYIEGSDDETPANRFYRALFQDILNALGEDLAVDTHVVARVRSPKGSDKENLDQVLLKASRHVTTTVVASWNKIFKGKELSEKRIRIDYGTEPSNEKDAEGTPLPDKIWIRFNVEDADGFFTVGERSLGFRWFFVYLLITTYCGQRSGHSDDMLFLFDEPASNLHPTAQTALLESLGEISQKAVVIYTTHSHHLIDPRWLGTTFVVANEGLGSDVVSADYTAKRTDIRITPYREFAAQHPDQSHFFQPILDVLDWAPSHLELVADVAMVEGKSDYYLLEYYQAVMLGLPMSKRLRLMPGGGAGTLDDVIQLYLGWSRPFVALLDSDRAGQTQAKRYREKFGAILDPHLVELAEAAGNPDVKGLESLLTDVDVLAFQRLVDPGATKMHKKTFALGVQEALVTGAVVKMSAATRKRLDRVIRALRDQLEAVAKKMEGASGTT